MRTQGYEATTVAEIAALIAARHGLSVPGEPPEIAISQATQRRERDLAFLARLAEDAGSAMSVRGDQLVFFSRDALAAADAARVFDVETPDLISYRLREGRAGTYARAELIHYDAETVTAIEASAEDASVPDGDTLEVDARVETQEQADALVTARLKAANRAKRTGSLSLVGDPALASGQVLTLGPGFGVYAGRWMVASSAHRLSRKGGYVTSLEIEGL